MLGGKQPNWVQRLNRAGLELWSSSAVGKSQRALSGDSRDPRQGTPYLGHRVKTCHLVLEPSDAKGMVRKKRTYELESPVSFSGVLPGQGLEFLVHLAVEVLPEEEGPEPE